MATEVVKIHATESADAREAIRLYSPSWLQRLVDLVLFLIQRALAQFV